MRLWYNLLIQKLYDNKEYKNAKRACEKILEKQPTFADALALKGLVMGHLGEKEEGNKAIMAAIKLNFSNPNTWHFYALFHKEDKQGLLIQKSCSGY